MADALAGVAFERAGQVFPADVKLLGNVCHIQFRLPEALLDIGRYLRDERTGGTGGNRMGSPRDMGGQQHQFPDPTAVELLAEGGVRHGGGRVDALDQLPYPPAADSLGPQNIQGRCRPHIRYKGSEHLGHEVRIYLEYQPLIARGILGTEHGVHRAGRNDQQLIRVKEEARTVGVVFAYAAPHKDKFVVRVGVGDGGTGLHVHIVAHGHQTAAELEVCHVLRQMLVNDRFHPMVYHAGHSFPRCITICDFPVTITGVILPYICYYMHRKEKIKFFGRVIKMPVVHFG